MHFRSFVMTRFSDSITEKRDDNSYGNKMLHVLGFLSSLNVFFFSTRETFNMLSKIRFMKISCEVIRNFLSVLKIM